jgi:hypothetical protein
VTAVLLRLGLAVLALPALLLAAWALVDPASFFREFPAVFGLRWLSPLPPYNEHLVNEVGVLRLALGSLALWAAARPHLSLVRPLLVAWSLQAVPHLVHHVQHLDAYDGSSAATVLAYLLLEAILPIVLLALALRPLPWRRRL